MEDNKSSVDLNRVYVFVNQDHYRKETKLNSDLFLRSGKRMYVLHKVFKGSPETVLVLSEPLID